ncbi:MAG: DUF2281 domain-containing protein [Syntrophobacteraceae bacterium]|nr:DUF2281 domain-containing protein [Syntrophobacteraceae bacterium]
MRGKSKTGATRNEKISFRFYSIVLVSEIVECIQRLPEPLQIEVLHFVEFLLAKAFGESWKEENHEWMGFSLQSACQNMEDEPGWLL